MSTETPPTKDRYGSAPEGGGASAFAQWLYGGSTGLITSVISTLLAFLAGGLVVLAIGKNPLAVYKGIFDGTGLNWFFPWTTGVERQIAEVNLQQTLLLTTTLILTGLAVAFAFRCGLFNIGGNGQWIVGAIVSIWVGTTFADLFGPFHIILAIVLATLAGALWAGIAGLLRATVGTHEVISTIMLNWVAYWLGSYLFGRGGPLQNSQPGGETVPISDQVSDSAKLPVFWGDAVLQGLHIGFFIALAGLVFYWLVLSRTTLGFSVRAVGRNAEGARYGGIRVGSSYFSAMAISGGFAGLGGAIDILGWQHALGVLDVQKVQIGFIGIAVALLGRNTAIGVFFSSLLFGALLYGTSSRSIDPTVFEPQLAGNLAYMINAFVLLFIGADVLVLYLWKTRRLPRIRMPNFRALWPRPGPTTTLAEVESGRAAPAARRPSWRPQDLRERLIAALPRGPAAVGWGGIGLAFLAVFITLPPIMTRSLVWPVAIGVLAAGAGSWAVIHGRRKVGYGAIVLAVAAVVGAVGAIEASPDNLDTAFVWSAIGASTLRFATPLIFGALGGMFSERSGVVNIGLEGMMLAGAFFAFLGAEKSGSWIVGILAALAAGATLALIHAVVSIHWRADQIVSGVAVNFLALGLTGFLFIQIYGGSTPSGVSEVPDVRLPLIEDLPFFGPIIGNQNLLIWVAFAMGILAYVVLFRTSFGLRLRSVGEHPTAADSVGLSVYRIRYTAVILSGMIVSLGGAFLSIGFVNSFTENMTNGRGFIALAAMIIGSWKPKGAIAACVLFGFTFALVQRVTVFSDSLAVLLNAFPYVVVLIVAAGLIGVSRMPASLGIPYVKK